MHSLPPHCAGGRLRLIAAGIALVASAPTLALTADEAGLVSRGALRGNDASQVMLAVAYLKGDGGLPKDAAQAAHWFELAALQGNAFAQERIGDLYEQGIGVTASPVLAFDWRLKAATRGNLAAQVKLAKMYLAGSGTARDERQARDWLERAAVEGSAEAQFLLGRMAHQAADSPAHRTEARNWLEQAARQGYERAAELLNLIESIGYSVEEGWHQHVPELSRLANDGDPEAQFLLAQRYEHGGDGIPRDPPQALRWYKAAAGNGHRASMLALSHIYESGSGVPRDVEAARSWARRATGAGQR